MAHMHYLIVEQKLKPPENLPEVIKELAHKHQLDLYQCRQRLIGRGLSLLTKGPREKLKNISLLLSSVNYSHWLVKPSKPGYIPHKVRNLQVTSEQIIFGCQEKNVTFPKGSIILAVFADISGTLIDKSVQQLLSNNAYRGRDAITHIEEGKLQKIILQGRPVLDLYRLNDQRQVEDAVRIFPGKFDPKGLGKRATISSKQNLLQILNLAEDYAGHFHLFSDFGLVNLPGCILLRENPDSPETLRQNLINLARYGWLMSDLLQTKKYQPNSEESPEEDLRHAVATAIAAQNPAHAAASHQDHINPLVDEIVEEITPSSKEVVTSAAHTTDAPGLPLPPPAKSSPAWSNPGFWIGTGGSLAVMVLFILFDLGDKKWFNKTAYHAFASGAIPLTISILMFWYAFYFLRMKRQIENTPTSRIRSVAMGMVEVKGRASRKFALISPMSHTPCVFYRLTKYRRESNNQWKVSSISSSDNVPFELKDDTGRVEIDPAGCRVSAGTKQEGTPGQVGLLRLKDDADDKWVEEIIVDGTLLYVLGYASTKTRSGPSLHEKKTEALRELKRNPQQMQQFDKNGDGQLDTDEWDAARAAMEENVMRDSLKDNSKRKKQEQHIVIGKKKGRPLIISETHSEDHLTALYLYYSIPLFLSAAIATGGAIYLLINYLRA